MLGDRLRALRQSRGLTLKELSAKAGLSSGMLSQIENNTADPSLSSLRKLAQVFEADISALFADPDAPAVHISRPEDRQILASAKGGFPYERLTPGRGELEVLRAVIPPGAASSAHSWAHPSAECVYVISGSLTVEVGETEYTIAEGEAVSFDSRLMHRYLNHGETAATIILAVTPPTP
jgi:transcriptional regulator with XRE-family HTH domain